MNLELVDGTYDWKDMTIIDFLNEGNIPTEWKKLFLSEIETLQDISISLNKIKYIIFPPIHQVFRAFYLTPLHKIKTVILGQDPYHNGSAVGICFSVLSGNKINPSLQNIYNELENEGFRPKKDGNLFHLCEQGCLLLNTALTVEKGDPESHVSIWYEFSEKVIRYISENTSNTAWLLMGKKALDFKTHIDTSKHKIFGTSHPSPLGAYRPYRNYPAFISSGVFRQINNYLQKINKKPIKW